MVRVAVFEVPALFASPGYDAVSVTDPAAEEVTVTLHELIVLDVPSGAKTHDSLAEIAPDPEPETVTVPVGAYPLIVTLHVDV